MIILRSAIFNVVFFAVTFIFTVTAVTVRPFAPDRVMGVAIQWAKTLVAATRLICGIRLEVTGLENIVPGAALIVSRHQSAFDTFVWLTLLPRCCYVLKHELLRIPLFGGLLTATRMIPIDRSAGSGAIRALLREADRAVHEERQIVIFPEGTRSEPGQPKALQPGFLAIASRTGLPIIPVATDLGSLLGPPFVPENSGHDPHPDRAADPPGSRSAGFASQRGRRHRSVGSTCGDRSACSCTGLWITLWSEVLLAC